MEIVPRKRRFFTGKVYRKVERARSWLSDFIATVLISIGIATSVTISNSRDVKRIAIQK